MIAGALRVLSALGMALGLLAGLFGAIWLALYVIGWILLAVPLTGKHKNKPLDLPDNL